MLIVRRLVGFWLASVPLLALDTSIRVDGGLLSGAAGTNPDVRVFKGVPYAAPPIGELRWKPPQPAAAWVGERDATKFSPVCYQQPYPEGSIYRMKPEPMSEDCLYLNIWTAARTAQERRPVMVWIHGGGLTRGSGSTPGYNGEALARKGVVLVTMNYRLGVLGYMAHPELTKESEHHASGNYGLLDQIAALKWVRKNIAAFGGDPNCVTIFGESAGSWSVNYLVATPLAKGLFHRAIGESGGQFGRMKTLAELEQISAKLGLPLQMLRAMPAADLVSAAKLDVAVANVDGWSLPEDVQTIFEKGEQNDVPLMAGSNADEGTTLASWPPRATAADFEKHAHELFGSRTDKFLKLYPGGSDEQAKVSHYAAFRDLTFGWQMRTWVRMQRKTGKSPAYLYYFTRVPPGPASALGAYHASEILYVFANLQTRPRPYEDADRKLAEVMSSYWTNFAARGDPNGDGFPMWPQYHEKSDIALELGPEVKLIEALHKPGLDLDGYFAGLRGEK